MNTTKITKKSTELVENFINNHSIKDSCILINTLEFLGKSLHLLDEKTSTEYLKIILQLTKEQINDNKNIKRPRNKKK